MRARPALVTASRWSKRNARYILTSFAIIVVYVIAAKLGLSLAYTTKQVTTVWPPSGIALAVLVLFGIRYLPSVYLGALIANALTQEPLLVAAGIAIGNMSEGLVGYLLLRKVFGFHRSFKVPIDVLTFGAASVMCALVAALWGPLMLSAGGLIHIHNYWSVAMTWWQGDLLGILLFAPLIISYLDPRALRLVRGRWPETVLMLLAITVVSVIVFGGPGRGATSYPYLLLPLVIWAAVRLTQIGAVTGAVLIAGIAISSTVHGLGPFATVVPVEQALIDLQIYVAMLAAMSLIIAVVITQRLSVEEVLREQTAELKSVELELKEANKRITNILAGVLDHPEPPRIRRIGKK